MRISDKHRRITGRIMWVCWANVVLQIANVAYQVFRAMGGV